MHNASMLPPPPYTKEKKKTTQSTVQKRAQKGKIPHIRNVEKRKSVATIKCRKHFSIRESSHRAAGNRGSCPEDSRKSHDTPIMDLDKSNKFVSFSTKLFE